MWMILNVIAKRQEEMQTSHGSIIRTEFDKALTSEFSPPRRKEHKAQFYLCIADSPANYPKRHPSA